MQFWNELPEVIEWLHGKGEKALKEAIPFGKVSIDESWHPPSMAQAWHTTVPLEKIRFAAANRLCVNMYYNDSYRLIEPYSLRRSQKGDILLYAVKHNTGEIRSYRVDRIQRAEATDIAFVPKHAIELTPSGPISAPKQTRRSDGITLSRPSIKTPTVRHSTGRKPSFGPRYVIECTYCGKKFNRKSYTTSLNAHKDKSGYPCPGRVGYMVDVKY